MSSHNLVKVVQFLKDKLTVLGNEAICMCKAQHQKNLLHQLLEYNPHCILVTHVMEILKEWHYDAMNLKKMTMAIIHTTEQQTYKFITLFFNLF